MPSDKIAEALAAYDRGERITTIEQKFGINRSTLYTELARLGRAPTRVQKRRIISRDATELAKEAWDRLEVLGKELARANSNNATLAARLSEVLTENDELRREIEALRLALNERDGKPRRGTRRR